MPSYAITLPLRYFRQDTLLDRHRNFDCATVNDPAAIPGEIEPFLTESATMRCVFANLTLGYFSGQGTGSPHVSRLAWDEPLSGKTITLRESVENWCRDKGVGKEVRPTVEQVVMLARDLGIPLQYGRLVFSDVLSRINQYIVTIHVPGSNKPVEKFRKGLGAKGITKDVISHLFRTGDFDRGSITRMSTTTTTTTTNNNNNNNKTTNCTATVPVPVVVQSPAYGRRHDNNNNNKTISSSTPTGTVPLPVQSPAYGRRHISKSPTVSTSSEPNTPLPRKENRSGNNVFASPALTSQSSSDIKLLHTLLSQHDRLFDAERALYETNQNQEVAEKQLRFHGGELEYHHEELKTASKYIKAHHKCLSMILEETRLLRDGQEE